MSETDSTGARRVPDAPLHEGRERPVRREGQYTDDEYEVEPIEGEELAAGEGVESTRGPDASAPVRPPGQYTDGEFDTGTDAEAQE